LFSGHNFEDYLFEEKKLEFNMPLSDMQDDTSAVMNQLHCPYKHMQERDNQVPYNHNSFPQITNFQTNIAETETRILEAFEKGSGLGPKIKTSEQFLLQNVGSKLKLVVLYVDLVDSTLMTRNFSVDKLATIIQMFTQEMSVAVSNFNGQVLKYVGDAVIAYFPMDKSNSLSCNSAIKCALYMIAILEQIINPVLMRNNYEQLQVRIGIDTSEHSIIQYVLGEKSYIDILGYGISMASKLTKLAKPNKIVTSHTVYLNMHSSLRKNFSELEISPSIWKHVDKKTQPGVWISYNGM
jgi:class 3 adenylate cyclase